MGGMWEGAVRPCAAGRAHGSLCASVSVQGGNLSNACAAPVTFLDQRCLLCASKHEWLPSDLWC
jgi:hypothetical protein